MARRQKAAIRSVVDCLGLGIIPLDFLVTIPHFPPLGGKVNADSLCVQGGGPVPNAMVGLSRLGLKTAIIAALGNDVFADISLEALRREKIDARFVIRKHRPSATAYGFVEAGSGRRTIALHRDIFVKPRDLLLARYPIPRLVHLDGRDLEATLKLARWARRIGAVVSFDIGSIRNDVTAVLPLVDHLVVADAFALPYTKTRSVRQALLTLARVCKGTVAVTVGTKGAHALENGEFYHHPAYRVKVADTTGAGDAFHVGYLYALLKGWDMTRRLLYGNAVAALKCTVPGARAGMPTRRQLSAFLQSKPRTYA